MESPVIGLNLRKNWVWLAFGTSVVVGLGGLLVLHSIWPAFSVTCGFKEFTALPCPSCGLTRMVFCLSRGQIAAAFWMNPLAFIVAGTGALAFLFVALQGFFPHVRRSKARTNFLLPKLSLRSRVGLLLLIVVNWVYLIVQGR